MTKIASLAANSKVLKTNAQSRNVHVDTIATARGYTTIAIGATKSSEKKMKDDGMEFCRHCGGGVYWHTILQRWFHDSAPKDLHLVQLSHRGGEE